MSKILALSFKLHIQAGILDNQILAIYFERKLMLIDQTKDLFIIFVNHTISCNEFLMRLLFY